MGCAVMCGVCCDVWYGACVSCGVCCGVGCVMCGVCRRSFTYLLDHETNKLRPVDFPVKVKLEQVRALGTYILPYIIGAVSPAHLVHFLPHYFTASGCRWFQPLPCTL